MFWRTTPAYRRIGGAPLPGSLASLEAVPIGGVTQWVLTRAVDELQPLLLYLHGGPGDGGILTARRTQAELERAFVVVNWDQRGCGLSYSPGMSMADLTIDRLVDDTVELSQWLLKRHRREKLVLMGHSWGTILGALAARRAPGLYSAYVGIAQVVDPTESDHRMRAWLLQEAKRRGSARALREIEAVPEGPAADSSVLGRWVERFGGWSRNGRSRALSMDTVLHLREYSPGDLVRWSRGRRFSLTALRSAVHSVDMARQVPRLEVPAYFLSGRDDRVCDPKLAREYLEVIDAPRKGWAWIEDAAYLAMWDQPEAVAAAAAHFVAEATHTPAPAWQVAG